MANMHEAIYARLTGYTAVSDLIGDRVYPTKAYRRFGDFAPHTQAGACGVAQAMYELEILANKPSEALAVAEATRNAMDGIRSVEIAGVYVRSASLTSESDSSILFEGSENERYQIEQDWDFWYFRTVPTL
jgi:hypothetical protein